MQLAKQLRARLLRTGKTQAEIGEASGLAQSTVGRFMNDTTDISLTNYARLILFCERHEARTARQATRAAP